MNGLLKRPLMLFCLVFFAGSCLFAGVSSSLRLLSCAVLPVLFLLILLVTGKNRSAWRRSALLACLAFFLAAFLSYLHMDLRMRQTLELDGESVTFTGTVTEVVSVTSYSGYYTVRGMEIGPKNLSFSFMLESDDPTLVPGDRISGTALFSSFPETENGFPLRRYYLSKSVMMEAQSTDAPVYLGEDNSLLIRLKGLNRRLAGIISSLLPREEAGFVNALLLGNKDTLSDEASRNFRRLGISHMLAISGMHLSVLTVFLDKILSLFLRKRRVRHLLLLPPIVFFMFLTGLSPSILRAGLMLILYEIMSLLSGREDPPSALFYASTIILLFQPYAALDVGLQLSVAAMAACLMFNVLLKKKNSASPKAIGIFRRTLRCAVQLFLLSLYVLLFILPLSYLYFGEISLFSPLMNVLFSPLITLLLFFSPFLLFFSSSYIFSAILAAAVRFLAALTLDLASLCAGSGIPVLSLHYELAPAAIGIIFLLTLAFPFTKKRGRIACSAAALLTLCLLCCQIALVRVAEAEKVTVHLHHRLKSDTLLLFSENQSLLCDFSDGSYAAVRGALGVLDNSYLIDLDVILLTHYHQRHVDTTQKLCSTRFVGEIWLPEPMEEAEIGIAESIQETAESLGTAVRFFNPSSETLYFGDAAINVSERGRIKRSTHPTLFLAIEAFGKDYIYAGASVMESNLAEAATMHLSDSEIAVIGVHGPIYKKPLQISAPTLSHLLFTGDTEPFLDKTESEFPSLQGEITVTEIKTVVLTPDEIFLP